MLRVPAADLRLLALATLLLVGSHWAKGMLPFRTLRRLVAREARSRVEANSDYHAKRLRIAWAVNVASRHMPWATCLTRALAVEAILVRHGYPAHLRIGVARKAGQPFEAHAWVESDGEAVFGAPEAGRYTTLYPAPEKAA